jgi:hypothetical protein
VLARAADRDHAGVGAARGARAAIVEEVVHAGPSARSKA